MVESLTPSALAPLPMRAGHLPMGDVIDLYMSHYAGRDDTRRQRLGWWKQQLASVTLQDLSDDHVHAQLEMLSTQHSRFYAGKDADDRAIYRAKRKPLAPATLNRYAASLAAVVTWAIKKRIAPKGYVHPCRSVERRPENNEKTRFLDDDERQRLLQACKDAAWPKLYLIVLMALTTGARKGELLGLRWGDIDLDQGLAGVAVTKNNDPRMLPLVPAVVDELRRFKGAPTALVFEARRNKLRAYAFEPGYLQALKQARIRGVTFHTLRHSCASSLARNGASLLEIGDVLGHRQMAMTKRYSHLATDHKAGLVHRVLGSVR